MSQGVRQRMPSILTPKFEGIPNELKERPQWVLWQGTLGHDKKTGAEKIEKVPYTAWFKKASSTNPATWATYDRVVKALPLALDLWADNPGFLGGGIGYVFSKDDPYVGVDIDKARDVETGEIASWATAILDILNTYAELSISGTGVHAIIAGAWPYTEHATPSVQIYSTARFFTMSGHLLPPYPTDIRHSQEAIDAAHALVWPPKPPKPAPKPRATMPVALTDDEIIRKARVAKNGAKFSALWEGDISGYESHSHADQALCSMLAFWTQDSAQLDSLVRQSGLYRDKWDSKRGGEGTYGANTIAYALEHLGERYDPQARKATTSPRPIPMMTTVATIHAGTNGTSPNIPHLGDDDPTHPPTSSIVQAAPLLCDKQERPYPDAGNFKTIFSHYPPWKERLWWDAFSQVPMHDDRILDDAAITDIAAWCGHTLQMSIRSEEQMHRSLLAVCKASPRDPLHEFVSGLIWDGTPRLATWLHEYCGARNTPAHAWIGTTLCCALVARALTPGCMQRYLVILEGAENIGKSAVASILGHPWSRALSRDVDTTDAMRLLRGCWVMEVPELDSFRKAEESRIKAFVSERKDTLVPKYANSAETYLRRTVLIGTVNPDGNGYLKGQTGNTRYLPVLCTTIDRDALERDRDQLYAEAAHMIAQGYQWWEEPPGIGLDDVREERRDTDIYESSVTQWLDNHHDHDSLDHVSLEEVLLKALKMEKPESWKDRALQMRIGVIIRGCGWERFQQRDGERRRWLYRKNSK